jgi:serine/threonine-protein kinase
MFKPGDRFYYFEVVRLLGRGYHGEVWEIRHPETGDAFALKTIHAADCGSAGKIARALAAAKGNYRIDHRNLVKVFDLNAEANGLVWMRTELLRGHTLQELIARQGRLSPPFALPAAIHAAFGLHAVHEAQIVHRDVKPSNLFYTEGRAVKVIDLSLAKVFPEGLETTAGRRFGLGSPAYSAPEQLEGLVRPDVRCDVFSLGTTLWEMLAGKHPNSEFLEDTPELIRRQLTLMPPLLADVAGLPPRVDVVVRRAIEKDPARRYASMMEMARALMDLDAWVAAEARARRLVISVPAGEPAVPGDTNTWRDYRAPETTPARDAPAPAPAERVLLSNPTPARAASPLAATEPLPPTPRGGLGGTLPFDEPSIGAPIVEPRPAVSRPQRETPPALSHTQPSAPGSRPPRRASWPFVIAAVAIASLGSVALVAWFHRAPAPAGPAPVPSASPVAQIEAPPTSTATPATSAPGTSAPVVPSAAPSVSPRPIKRPPTLATVAGSATAAPPPTATAARHRVFGSEQ